MKKKTTLCNGSIRLVLAGVFILTGSSAIGADLNSEFSASIGRSDNVLRTDDNQIEETIATVGLEADLLHEGPRLSADVYVNADYIEYVDDAFDSDLEGGATAVAGYWFLVDRFGWNLQYNFGQQVFDPLAPIRPDNRENVSYLTTGPQLEFPIGSRFEFQASVDFSDTSYEINPNDQRRLGGRASIGRLLGAGRTLSIVGTQEDVNYDDGSPTPDFERRGLFLRFESINARGTFTVDLGVNELELDGVAETGDGTLFRLDWMRLLSNGVELTLGAGTRYSDQGDIFRFFQNAAFDLVDTENVSGVGSPFRNNYGSVIFSLEKQRTTIDLVALYSDEDYEFDSTFDREVKQLSLEITRDFTNRLFGELGIDASSREFISVNRDDRDVQYTFSLGYRFNTAFSTMLSYQHFERSTNQGVTEFDEDRIFLQFNYVPKWTRETP